jgi:hypothetical protein
MANGGRELSGFVVPRSRTDTFVLAITDKSSLGGRTRVVEGNKLNVTITARPNSAVDA